MQLGFGLPELRDVFLIAVAVFLVLIPWFEALSFGADSGMAVYGTSIGASVVLAIAVGSSLATGSPANSVDGF